MATRDGAESACANPNPIVDGRKANVNLAYLGAKPKTHSQPCELLWWLMQEGHILCIMNVQSP